MQNIPHHSHDTIRDNFEKIQKLFPSVVDEVKDENGNIKKELNIDELKKLFDNKYNENPIERYSLNWPGKRRSLIRANTPLTDTLRPVRDESVDFDTTKNLYIEWDNFAVLKTLQHAYMGKVKMIYIDPPYNTGKDFVYNDNFTEDLANYREKTGEIVDGVQMEKNTDTNGRFHSDWLSIMYERLIVARDLLTDDGVIFMSIDDNEVHNLRKLADEVFGEENFVAEIIWEQWKKSIASQIAINHEYCLVFCKNKEENKEFDKKNINFNWSTRKEWLESIYDEFEKLKKEYGNNYIRINEGLKKFFDALPEGHKSKNHKHYRYADPSLGIYYQGDISQGTGQGWRFNIIHPITNKPCKLPSGWWRFSEEKLPELLSEWRIEFWEDETTVPCLKRYLKETEYEVFPSVIYKDWRWATNRLKDLFGVKIFDNPKDEETIKNFIKIVTSYQRSDDIILDFFSGSATTAQAVMELNLEDGWNRKFILVQIPQVVEEKWDQKEKQMSKNAKNFLTSIWKPHNICEIGKERIRRAAAKIRTDFASQIAERETPLDTGFRVYKLDSTCRANNELHPFDTTQMNIEDNISAFKPDRSAEDILTEILLREGQMLSGEIVSKKVGENTIYIIDGGIVACLDKSMSDGLTEAIITENPHTIIFSDEIFGGSDSLKINTENKIETAFGKGNVSVKVF